MKAKPSKCLSMSMKCTGAEFVLSNQQVPSIIQAPMKFLGMYMYVYLELKEIRFMIKKKLEDLLETTSKDKITGPMKAWVYNHLIKMSWGFTVYNLPIIFVRELEVLCNRYLRKWLGIAHPCTTTVLYTLQELGVETITHRS